MAEHQKHIPVADESEHSWETVAAYIGSDVAYNEEDVRRIKKAEKTAEQRVSKRRRKGVAASAPSQCAKSQVPVTGTQARGPAGQPTQYLLSRPPYQSQTLPASSTRTV